MAAIIAPELVRTQDIRGRLRARIDRARTKECIHGEEGQGQEKGREEKGREESQGRERRALDRLVRGGAALARLATRTLPMALTKLDFTLDVLRKVRERSPSILVAFSGGKDSCAVVDMCSRIFDRVEGFYMYLVPGMEVVEDLLRVGRERWGLKIHQYPHWLIRRYLQEGMYCFTALRHDNLPEWELHDVFSLASHETGIPIVATGAKDADSATRRRILSLQKWSPEKGTVVYPIQTWKKHDVLGYLKAHDIPAPTTKNRTTTYGAELSTPEVLYLHDNYPGDYQKLLKYFPLAHAIVARREFYGVTTDLWGAGKA
jgi:phosphoadenosine phosphosulfate reductase